MPSKYLSSEKLIFVRLILFDVCLTKPDTRSSLDVRVLRPHYDSEASITLIFLDLDKCVR